MAAIAAIWSSEDLARVLVLVSTGGTAVGATGTSTLYAGDAISWRAITTWGLAASDALDSVEVSADAAMMYTYEAVANGGENLRRFDGTVFYSLTGGASLVGFAPDSSYFLYSDGAQALHARTPSGSDNVVASANSVGGPQTVEVLFPSSLILSTNTTGGDLPAQGAGLLHFVDVDGNALSVPGFDTDPSVLNAVSTSPSNTTPTNILDRFEVVGGRVMRMTDRGAVPLGSVPTSIGAGVVVANAQGTLVGDNSTLQFLDAAGNVKSTFQPSDPILCPKDPNAPSPGASLLLASLDSSPRWALLQVGHAIGVPGCTGGPNGSIGETDDVIWDMDGNRTKVLDARLGDTSWYGPEYQPSPDGSSLVWIHGAALTRFRISAFAQDVIPTAAVPVESRVRR